MNLIDQTFFVRELLVPGVENALVYEPLCQFISQYEPVMLEAALGYSFYQEFITAIGENPQNGKWFDLCFGAEFTYGGRVYKWKGLKSKSTEVKRSIIANYVYYKYIKDGVTQTSIMGEVSTNTENASKATPGLKLQRAWNEMTTEIHWLWKFLENKSDDDGNLVYDTFVRAEINPKHFQPVFIFGF